MPTPAQIKVLRASAGLTQTQAGELVYAALRSYQHWEDGDRDMSAAAWELFKINVDELRK